MNRRLDEIKRLFDQCTRDEQRLVLAYVRRTVAIHPIEAKFNTTAEAILSAIARSPDLTQRGIRGILAEATFEQVVLPRLNPLGWKSVPTDDGSAHDFYIQHGQRRVGIQVKLQRKERDAPELFSARARAKLKVSGEKRLYVAEVQRTRSGMKRGAETRPYRFGDFDILAVNLHPSAGSWENFVYTVADWLLPTEKHPDLIAIFQPVSPAPDEYWSNRLEQCLAWLAQADERKIYQ